MVPLKPENSGWQNCISNTCQLSLSPGAADSTATTHSCKLTMTGAHYWGPEDITLQPALSSPFYFCFLTSKFKKIQISLLWILFSIGFRCAASWLEDRILYKVLPQIGPGRLGRGGESSGWLALAPGPTLGGGDDLHITLLLVTIVPILYFTSLWLVCNC